MDRCIQFLNISANRLGFLQIHTAVGNMTQQDFPRQMAHSNVANQTVDQASFLEIYGCLAMLFKRSQARLFSVGAVKVSVSFWTLGTKVVSVLPISVVDLCKLRDIAMELWSTLKRSSSFMWSLLHTCSWPVGWSWAPTSRTWAGGGAWAVGGVTRSAAGSPACSTMFIQGSSSHFYDEFKECILSTLDSLPVVENRTACLLERDVPDSHSLCHADGYFDMSTVLFENCRRYLGASQLVGTSSGTAEWSPRHIWDQRQNFGNHCNTLNVHLVCWFWCCRMISCLNRFIGGNVQLVMFGALEKILGYYCNLLRIPFGTHIACSPFYCFVHQTII